MRPFNETTTFYRGEDITYPTMGAWVRARRNDQGDNLCVFCDTVLQPRYRYCKEHSAEAYREIRRRRMERYRQAWLEKKTAQNPTLPQHAPQPVPSGSTQDRNPQAEEEKEEKN